MMIENQRVQSRGGTGAARQAANPSGGVALSLCGAAWRGHPRNRVRLLYDLTPVRFSASKSFPAGVRSFAIRDGGLGERGRIAKGAGIQGGDSSQVGGFPYIYRWARMGRKGQRCNVLARGKMNSCVVQFQDGFTAVTSRNAIRKAKPDDR